MNTINELELSYLAGFFDGEGCITISRSIRLSGNSKSPIYNLSVVISQSNKEIVEYWCDTLGIGSVHEKIKLEQHYLDGYDLRIQSSDAVKFLKRLLPYLRIKKEQAEIAIKFQETMGHYTQYSITKEILNERENYYQLMKKFKSGGRGRKGKGDALAKQLIDEVDIRREQSREKMTTSNKMHPRK